MPRCNNVGLIYESLSLLWSIFLYSGELFERNESAGTNRLRCGTFSFLSLEKTRAADFISLKVMPTPMGWSKSDCILLTNVRHKIQIVSSLFWIKGEMSVFCWKEKKRRQKNYSACTVKKRSNYSNIDEDVKLFFVEKDENLFERGIIRLPKNNRTKWSIYCLTKFPFLVKTFHLHFGKRTQLLFQSVFMYNNVLRFLYFLTNKLYQFHSRLIPLFVHSIFIRPISVTLQILFVIVARSSRTRIPEYKLSHWPERSMKQQSRITNAALEC